MCRHSEQASCAPRERTSIYMHTSEKKFEGNNESTPLYFDRNYQTFFPSPNLSHSIPHCARPINIYTCPCSCSCLSSVSSPEPTPTPPAIDLDYLLSHFSYSGSNQENLRRCIATNTSTPEGRELLIAMTQYFVSNDSSRKGGVDRKSPVLTTNTDNEIGDENNPAVCNAEADSTEKQLPDEQKLCGLCKKSFSEEEFLAHKCRRRRKRKNPY